MPEERIWLLRTDAMRAVFCLFNNYDEAADMVGNLFLLQFDRSIDNRMNSNRSFNRPEKLFSCCRNNLDL